MADGRPRLLFVTDLTYPAKGRRYCDEDIFLTSRLRADFDLALCHPLDAAALMDGGGTDRDGTDRDGMGGGGFDAVVVRNSGPVLHHQAAYDDFRARALARGVPVCTQLTGKGDQAGKQYLVDLTAQGFPVIPTVDRPQDLGLLPEAAEYVVKPKRGADSIGLEFVPPGRLRTLAFDEGPGVLVQPRIDFRYEVSFYYVDHTFQYALHAPRPDRRWHLERYEPTAADLEFADRFIAWNDIDHGVQRVDACRAPDGRLLLVELEDLNPYLSLDLLDDATRDAFVASLTASLHRLLGRS
ncbi:hypothetical protein [Streptomyces sp. MMBL 11-3]|uniref:hypothetical protein n=1 Tax=Streptomyces sp. MMBL 11-3 TaxID=3382639 RepID=UPI0039B3FC51